MPPLVIDRKSRRVVDGFHRGRAYKQEKIELVEVVEKSYRNDGEMFLDAVRYNASHGRGLSPFDRARCILRAESMKIELEQVASALSITCEAAGALRANRVGKLHGGQTSPTPLKHTIEHMVGRVLTKAQWETNNKLGGQRQQFYANQLISLIENKLLDTEDERLMVRLARLAELLAELGVNAMA